MLEKLITEKTKILELNNNYFSKNEKLRVLDINYKNNNKYIKKMYYLNDYWYYFKTSNSMYPFSLFNELIGTYLSKLLNIKSVTYDIAFANNTYGITSRNFKSNKYDYYFLSNLPIDYLEKGHLCNIQLLRNLCIDEENYKNILNSILKLLAIDLYMLQSDRGIVNLQFEINKETKYFDLAPIYDFSNCMFKQIKNINIPNPIINLNSSTLAIIMSEYPNFKEYLEILLDNKMSNIWNYISIDYSFNMESMEYDRIHDYYEIKEENVKKYIKQILNYVQK